MMKNNQYSWGIGYSGKLHTAFNRKPWGDIHLPPNILPVASFTVSASDLLVSVNASNSLDADGTIVSYQWDWGDSTPTSSGVIASHTYSHSGMYIITLTVVDNRGDTTAATSPVSVFESGNPGIFSTGLPRKVFADSSFWTKPLPDDAPLDAASEAKRSFLIQKGIEHWGNPGLGYPSFALNSYTNTPPVVVVDNSTPIINSGAGMTLRESSSAPYFNNLRTMFQGVRLPSGFVHDVGGTDGFLIIYNRDTDTYWDFWVVRKDASGWPGWSAQRGHRIENASTKQGIAEEYPGGYIYGSNAAGLAEVGGVIMLQELEEGLIPHVINMSVPVACLAHRDNIGISAPAVRSDGDSMETGAIQMGQRVRLPANFDVDTPNFHPVTRTIARAFRDYGAIVMDRSGDISFRGENRTSLTNGASRWNAVMEGAEGYNVMWNYNGYTPFPWGSLQIVAPNYLAP